MLTDTKQITNKKTISFICSRLLPNTNLKLNFYHFNKNTLHILLFDEFHNTSTNPLHLLHFHSVDDAVVEFHLQCDENEILVK